MKNTDDKNNKPQQRLALSLQETAEALGLSYITIYRLMKRGKLRAVPGVRHKLIPMREIERFLATAGEEEGR